MASRPGRHPRRDVAVAAVLAEHVAAPPHRGRAGRRGRRARDAGVQRAALRPQRLDGPGEQLVGPLEPVRLVAEDPSQLGDGAVGAGLADRRRVGLLQPSSTEGTTTSGLNTPNAAATTVPGDLAHHAAAAGEVGRPVGQRHAAELAGLGVEAERLVGPRGTRARSRPGRRRARARSRAAGRRWVRSVTERTLRPRPRARYDQRTVGCRHRDRRDRRPTSSSRPSTG